MKKLGKVLTVLLPVVALFLESLPYGAVLIFKDFPDRTIRTTYSYFSPTPWGYANFPPGITALLTCVLLMAAILAAAKLCFGFSASLWRRPLFRPCSCYII